MQIQTIPGSGRPALAVHGGAGARPQELTAEGERAYRDGLDRALQAGREVLDRGGSALDAVCAAVIRLEDDELFNAGRGAALTADGTAELDAAVMTGAGAAGAVAVCRTVRNPVLAARAVMERTRHVLMVAPAQDLLSEWGIRTVPRDYFVTERRRAELVAARARGAAAEAGTRHGTVGAVARDSSGRVAAATSTGGMTNQLPGRVGDSPIIGAGTFASNETAAISCTGEGEYFLRGVLAHDISARMCYQGIDLEAAVRATVAQRLDRTGGSGGLIAVGADGTLVLGYNSEGMFRGFWDGTQLMSAV
jgi:beta-aspartyl-peptidase (threonine type)